MYKYETKLNKVGFSLIAGCDEAGRGPLAGPVVAASVILPEGYKNDKINDSKKLTEKQRENLFDEIKEISIAYSIVFLDAAYVDKHNPKQSSRDGMKLAIEQLETQPEHVLIDFEKLDIEIPSTSIVKGDANSITIAAASILAKVSRDRYMKEAALKYPQYGFEKHKGYGTKFHREMIFEHGLTPEHRKTFKVKK